MQQMENRMTALELRVATAEQAQDKADSLNRRRARDIYRRLEEAGHERTELRTELTGFRTESRVADTALKTALREGLDDLHTAIAPVLEVHQGLAGTAKVLKVAAVILTSIVSIVAALIGIMTYLQSLGQAATGT